MLSQVKVILSLKPLLFPLIRILTKLRNVIIIVYSLSTATNPATGQADFSQAWAQYYRNQGMHYQADLILQQATQAQQGGAVGHPGGHQQGPNPIQQQ